MTEMKQIIQMVQEKLCHVNAGTVDDFKFAMVTSIKCDNELRRALNQASSALLAVLVGLDFDFTCPTPAADLVASRLRWAVASNDTLARFLTPYQSEPILAEATSLLFFRKMGPGSPIYSGVLNLILNKIEKEDYDFGSDGELTARILCLLDPLRN